LAETAGKEDPIELDSSLQLRIRIGDIAYPGEPSSTLKHRSFNVEFSYLVKCKE